MKISFLLSFFLSFFAHANSISPADLQTLERDTAFEAIVAFLDHELSDCLLEYKTTGTSLGLKVKWGNAKVGKWLPKNDSANPESQVVAYRLGRYLNMSALVIPSVYFPIEGRAVSSFTQMLRARKEDWNGVRQKNHVAILAALAKNPSSMFGALTASANQFEVATLVDTENNTINREHPIADFIRADGAMPTNQEITLIRRRASNGKIPANSELLLAREFSKIMVLDILTGQYDRWTGGNVEVIFTPDARLHFIARDNGGAYLTGRGTAEKYFGIVSRFDRAQIKRISTLAEELRKNPSAVASVLQLRSNPKFFASRISALLSRVDLLARTYGEQSVYFPE